MKDCCWKESRYLLRQFVYKCQRLDACFYINEIIGHVVIVLFALRINKIENVFNQAITAHQLPGNHFRTIICLTFCWSNAVCQSFREHLILSKDVTSIKRLLNKNVAKWSYHDRPAKRRWDQFTSHQPIHEPTPRLHQKSNFCLEFQLWRFLTGTSNLRFSPAEQQLFPTSATRFESL